MLRRQPAWFFNDPDIVRSGQQQAEQFDFPVIAAFKKANAADLAQTADGYRGQKPVLLGRVFLGDKNEIGGLQHQCGLSVQLFRTLSDSSHQTLYEPASKGDKIGVVQSLL